MRFIYIVIDLRNKEVISTHKKKETALNNARRLNKKYNVKYYYNTSVRK